MRLSRIAESNYKSDEIDAELLARRRLAGLIPEVHPKASEQREQAVLLRNRARLVRERTWMVNRIHAHIHNVGLHLEHGRLLTEGVACPPAARPGRMRVQRPQQGEGLEDEKATQAGADRTEVA